MFNLYKSGKVYFTDDCFYSSYPFPSEWIELFKSGKMESSDENNIFERFTVGVNVKYEPVIAPREMINIKTEKLSKLGGTFKSFMSEQRKSPSPCFNASKITINSGFNTTKSNYKNKTQVQICHSPYMDKASKISSKYYQTLQPRQEIQEKIKTKLISELKSWLSTPKIGNNKKRRRIIRLEAERKTYGEGTDFSDFESMQQVNSTKSALLKNSEHDNWTASTNEYYSKRTINDRELLVNTYSKI